MRDLIQIVKEDGPVLRSALAKELGVTEREVRSRIRDLNLTRKTPIVFTGKGFILASKRADINYCADKLISAGIANIQRAAALKKTDVEKMVRHLNFAAQGQP